MANTSKANNNFQRIAPFITISFVVGFGIASMAFFAFFCEECFEIELKSDRPSIDEKM